MDKPTYEQLQSQLDEAREIIRALRHGEVDAIISERELALVRLRATEDALRKLTTELEDRIHERTLQLEETNRRLEATMSELRATQVRVLESERITALAALAAAVAHEVNSPLMGVLNAVGYVRKHEDRPEFKEALQDADDGLRLISAITRNLLTFAHSREKTRLRADVRSVVDRSLNFLQADLESRGIAVTRDLPDNLPMIFGDEVRLQQVLSNLITNARDAVEESSKKEISLRAHLENGQMFVEVGDTGPGIPQALQERIFEPFYTTKTGRGTGLGLPVSRGIVEDFGGELTVESEPGHGARFIVKLPLSGAGKSETVNAEHSRGR